MNQLACTILIAALAAWPSVAPAQERNNGDRNGTRGRNIRGNERFVDIPEQKTRAESRRRSSDREREWREAVRRNASLNERIMSLDARDYRNRVGATEYEAAYRSREDRSARVDRDIARDTELANDTLRRNESLRDTRRMEEMRQSEIESREAVPEDGVRPGKVSELAVDPRTGKIPYVVTGDGDRSMKTARSEIEAGRDNRSRANETARRQTPRTVDRNRGSGVTSRSRGEEPVNQSHPDNVGPRDTGANRNSSAPGSAPGSAPSSAP